jgi:hypothetical protein
MKVHVPRAEPGKCSEGPRDQTLSDYGKPIRTRVEVRSSPYVLGDRRLALTGHKLPGFPWTWRPGGDSSVIGSNPCQMRPAA